MNVGKELFWPFPVQQEVVCSIDDEQVECSELGGTPFTGVPAPRVLEDDDWFGFGDPWRSSGRTHKGHGTCSRAPREHSCSLHWAGRRYGASARRHSKGRGQRRNW